MRAERHVETKKRRERTFKHVVLGGGETLSFIIIVIFFEG